MDEGRICTLYSPNKSGLEALSWSQAFIVILILNEKWTFSLRFLKKRETILEWNTKYVK